jgi:amidophosphoribosyltransferase
MHDKFREECGLMAVWNHPEAANLTYLGLYAQQHRGQEGAGVVSIGAEPAGATTFDSKPRFHIHKGLGLVAEVFEDYDFSQLPGKTALGHVRYSTAGGHMLANVQPFYAQISLGEVAVAHNGNLVNADALRAELSSNGAIFSANSDTEVVLHLLAQPFDHEQSNGQQKSEESIPARRVSAALRRIKGAYSLILLFGDRMFAVRDPAGVRPLSLGRLNDGLVLASETCAFDLVGAEFIRDLEPGELVEIGIGQEIKSYFPFEKQSPAPCIFEHVYFARPDSSVFGRSVYLARKRMGQELAREHPVQADVVVPVPDSGVTAALGYSEVSGVPIELGLIRNHYVGRTFIEPKQSIRDFGAKIKLNPIRHLLEGKSVVVIDDSIVRGTTSRKLIQMLRQAGAREIHMRVSAPPIHDPCYYGIDTPSKEELIAARLSIEEIRQYLCVDSLGYLSMEALYRAVQATQGSFCDACFSGRYALGRPVDYPVAPAGSGHKTLRIATGG